MDTDTIFKSLRQELTCPFLCERELIKDPVVLQNCGHIFCFECVKGWLKSRKRTCPVCRAKIKETNFEQDKVGVTQAAILQPNLQLKSFFGLIEILLSQDVPAQQDDANLLRSFQQLQFETNSLKMQRQVMQEQAKLLGTNSEDDEDTGREPDPEDDRDYEADPHYESDPEEPEPPRSNNNTPLRKSTRRYKN